MIRRLMFIIFAVIVIATGGMSVLGVLFFLGHYGISHLLAACIVFVSGGFFLATVAFDELSQYRTYLFYIPIAIAGIVSTRHMIAGGAEQDIGYILVPLFILLLSAPLMMRDNDDV